jgi:hypothetical protein
VLQPNAAKPVPVQVHLGITDGIYTEVIDGLHDNDMVVDALLSASPTGSGPQPGGMKRPF